jgi:5-methylcytosine-specific restriction endonuclease McrA
MLCSGSESSDVEHFMPKALYPSQAMNWENYLWACGICNRLKGNQFPEEGRHLINPLDENVWTFFFIDEFGLLTPVCAST